MNIYLISQNVKIDYDVYESAVVIAPSKQIAQSMSPCNGNIINWKLKEQFNITWVKNKNDVKVTLLGKAKRGSKQQLICSSVYDYNL